MSAAPTTRARSAPPESPPFLSERVDVDRGSEDDMPYDRNSMEDRDLWWHRDDSWVWGE